jgi:hypothetical protein
MSSLKKGGPVVAAPSHLAVAAVVVTGANTFESWRTQHTRGVPVVRPPPRARGCVFVKAFLRDGLGGLGFDRAPVGAFGDLHLAGLG